MFSSSNLKDLLDVFSIDSPLGKSFERVYGPDQIQAAINILLDFQLYQLDDQRLEPSKVTLFKQGAHYLKSKIISALLQDSKCNPSLKKQQASQEIQDLNNYFRTNPNTDQNFDEYYKIMAHKVAYGEWRKGDKLPGPSPIHPDYVVSDIITNEKGLQIVILVPDKDSKGTLTSPPIIACRGTCNIENIIDDFSDTIGMRGLQPSLGRVERALKQVTEEFGPAVICGHSLGGTIAQILTAKFCDRTASNGKTPWIQECFHYNSPGCGEELASEYARKKALLPAIRRPHVVATHHEIDIGYRAGGPHLEANKEVVIKNHKPVDNLIKDIWKAHSDLTLDKNRVDQSILVNHNVKEVPDIYSTIVEGLRSTVGKVAKVALETLFKSNSLTDLAPQRLLSVVS